MIQYAVIILHVALITSAVPYNDFDDLSTLGERISANVRNELAPLQNLGSRINAAVQQSLQPLRSGNYYQATYVNGRQLHESSFGDLGSQIAASVQAGLAPLNNLGPQIQQSVYQGLEPVRAMEIVLNMKAGVGGVTIATHSPSGKQFLIKEKNFYQCKGKINNYGQCEGNLVPYNIKNNSDFCFIRNSYSIINDYICIGATTVQVVNNNIRCENYNNAPVLVMKKDEFNKMCKNLSQNVEYKYIADPNDPSHVKIPNENKYVRCSNNEPNVCIFSESTSLTGSSTNIITQGNSYSSNIIIQ